MLVDFNSMPDTARVWVYQSNRPLTDSENQQLGERARVFAEQWQSHGRPVAASALLTYNRFLVFFADESSAAVSGCSIDSSVAFVREIESEFNLNFFDRMQVVYLKDVEKNEIDHFDFRNFKDLQKEGSLSSSSLIFNNLVQNKGEFLQSWQTPIADSWLAAQL